MGAMHNPTSDIDAGEAAGRIRIPTANRWRMNNSVLIASQPWSQWHPIKSAWQIPFFGQCGRNFIAHTRRSTIERPALVGSFDRATAHEMIELCLLGIWLDLSLCRGRAATNQQSQHSQNESMNKPNCCSLQVF